MHLAWVIHGSLEQRTGGTIYDRLVVAGCRSRGDLVSVVSVTAGSDPAELSARLLAARADVVVGDALASRELAGALPSLEGSALRVLLVHHLTSWEDRAPRREQLLESEARAIRASEHLIATSAWTAARLAAEHGRAADVVVPGADRLARVAPIRSDPDAGVVLLFAGSLLPRKRLSLLLDAMERLAHPRLTLRIVGDPARDPGHAAALDARIARSPLLLRSVARLGLVDDDALAHELARADALVLPSSLEGYGMVLTEALHAALPVIAARAGAMPDVVGASAAAMVLDDEGWVDGLRLFASEAGLRRRMRQAAEAGRASLPSWQASSLAFGEVLSRAVARAARGPSTARAR
ncbi:MAG TPA: glycosyltransferase family 4 protein [Polyangiaceae bacterium]